jgi:ribosomal protein L11 methyltransferase
VKTRLVLTPGQRGSVSRGRFVHVDVGDPATPLAAFGDSVLVGRVGGRWRAYTNVCRHRACPLDLGADSPMSDDGRFLLCNQHGALYRLSDGECVSGPCQGERLSTRTIAEDGDHLMLGEQRPEGRDGASESASGAPRYPYLTIEVAPHQADDAGALLFELGARGVEERDATTLARGASGGVTLIGSFETDDEAHAAMLRLPLEYLPAARVDAVVGDAWRDEWKRYFEPFELAGGIVVTPPWRERAAGAGERVLVLEPGRAFGTGLHETTRLVAEAMVEHAERFRDQPILDIGCGSGILSLVALALGASVARALDVDPEAVAVTRENAARNQMNERVLADGASLSSLSARYDAVVANIEATTLVGLAGAIVPRVADGGLLVLSGILGPDVAPGQLDGVRHAYRALREEGVRQRGEWVAVLFRA